MKLDKMYLIVILIMLTMLLALSAFTYSQYRENKELTSKNHILSELYHTEQINTETMRNTIEAQNKQIEKFKIESQTFEKRVEELNAEVDRLNNEPPVYIYMDRPKEETTGKPSETETDKPKEEIEKKEITTDEAMKWLLEKSASLSQ